MILKQPSRISFLVEWKATGEARILEACDRPQTEGGYEVNERRVSAGSILRDQDSSSS
jgi:hypothetical protein